MAYEDSLAYGRGFDDKVTPVHLAGLNQAVGGALEDCWPVGGTYPWIVTPSQLRIKAGGNANDTAAGSGARQVTLIGLDTTGSPLTQVLTTAGAAASSYSSSAFLRLNYAYVSSCGTYLGSNAGNIWIEDSGGNSVGIILAGNGGTEQPIYSVPLGHTLYLTRLQLSFTKDECAAYVRIREAITTKTAPVEASRAIWHNRGTDLTVVKDFRTYYPLPELTDIWSDGMTFGTTSIHGFEFDGFLVED